MIGKTLISIMVNNDESNGKETRVVSELIRRESKSKLKKICKLFGTWSGEMNSRILPNFKNFLGLLYD